MGIKKLSAWVRGAPRRSTSSMVTERFNLVKTFFQFSLIEITV